MKYLVPFDFSEVSKNAVKHTIRLAKTSGGEIHILHFIEDRDKMKIKSLELNSYLSTLEQIANCTIHGQVVLGDIFNDIGKIADYHGADLVIMGTHGVDAMQKFFGSNAIKIIRQCSVPFIIVQEKCDATKLKKIVMPISIETKSMQILRFAAQISKLYQAEIHLVGRLHDDEFLKHKENSNVILAKKYLVENNVKHVFHLVDISKGKFQEYILDYASKNEMDMIATTYFSDSLLPMFEKFVQNFIVNEQNIPVLCMNAKSLAKSDSILSFMTN